MTFIISEIITVLYSTCQQRIFYFDFQYSIITK